MVPLLNTSPLCCFLRENWNELRVVDVRIWVMPGTTMRKLFWHVSGTVHSSWHILPLIVEYSPLIGTFIGAFSLIFFFNSDNSLLIRTLHENCPVQTSEKHYLLSGSADGVILVWEIHAKERKVF